MKSDNHPDQSIETTLMSKFLAAFPVPETAITHQTDLFQEGVINSMDLLSLIEIVESEFDISVLDSEVISENFSSISMLATYIKSKK